MQTKPCRWIKGLISADLCSRPKNIPVSRPRGRKGAGVKYEKELAKAIPTAKHGQWFRFIDSAGIGCCQTDLLLKTAVGFAILEAKYTWTEAGHQQIERLYVPVVEKVFPGLPAFGIVVCKVLTPEVNPVWICRSLTDAIERASSGRKTVLHWTGCGLGPLQLRSVFSPIDSDLHVL